MPEANCLQREDLHAIYKIERSITMTRPVAGTSNFTAFCSLEVVDCSAYYRKKDVKWNLDVFVKATFTGFHRYIVTTAHGLVEH